MAIRPPTSTHSPPTEPEDQVEATARLNDLTIKLLSLAASAFVAPPFFDPKVAPKDVPWPKGYVDAKVQALDQHVLAAIGALMLEWATIERSFNAVMRQMATYPPVAGTELASGLDLYSFKAKALAWKRLQDLIFEEGSEILSMSKFMLSRAKQLSNIRNEIAHWGALPGNKELSVTLFLIEGNPASVKYWSEWTEKNLYSIAMELVHFRTALLAFTQHGFSIWYQKYYPLQGIPIELTSDTGLLVLRSYQARRPIARPPRHRGPPPQLGSSGSSLHAALQKATGGDPV